MLYAKLRKLMFISIRIPLSIAPTGNLRQVIMEIELDKVANLLVELFAINVRSGSII